jgi:hypothetical protein
MILLHQLVLNVDHMFGKWLDGVDTNSKAMIRIGVSALCWSIWRCRNDIIFNKKRTSNFLQVIHLVVHWVHLWAYLLPSGQRDAMVSGSNRFLVVAHEFFNRASWQAY